MGLGLILCTANNNYTVEGLVAKAEYLLMLSGDRSSYSSEQKRFFLQ